MASPFPLRDAKEPVEYRGVMVDKVTRAILIAAEEDLGYPLTIMQGGFRPRTPYSGTTHTKGGVGDLAAWDWENKCRVLNALGCYAYHRPALPNVWGEHIHFGVIDHPYRDSELAAQQDDWLHNPPLNGLKGHAPYTGPHPGKKIVFKYDPRTEREVKPMTEKDKAIDALVRALHFTDDAMAHLNEGKVARAQVPKLRAVKKDLREVIKVVKSKD